MDLLRWLSRSGRAVAALWLLATFVVGEVADTRHHLSDHGCAADAQSPGRDDHCTCTGLHVAPLAGMAPVVLAPASLTGESPVPSAASCPTSRAASAGSPRAPPKG